MKEKRMVRVYDNAKRRHSYTNFGYGFDDAFKEFCRVNYRKTRIRIFRPDREKCALKVDRYADFNKSFFAKIKERFLAKLASRARNKRARLARRVMRANA